MTHYVVLWASVYVMWGIYHKVTFYTQVLLCESSTGHINLYHIIFIALYIYITVHEILDT